MINRIDESKVVMIDYTNYRGERKIYKILPKKIGFGSTEYHPDDQWMLEATDLDRNVERTFAIQDIHSWTPV